MIARQCHLDHDCVSEVWHEHRFADKSGSIRWSTDELHLASRLIHDSLVNIPPSEPALRHTPAQPANDSSDAFSALNSREPDPELW